MNPLSAEQGNAETAMRNGFSLCFEDRDGVAGLNRYYAANRGLYNGGKRVEAYMRLRPEDIEPLVSPNRLGRDFRAMYRLKIGGETAIMRLEEVCGYDPSAVGSTKCVFVKE